MTVTTTAETNARAASQAARPALPDPYRLAGPYRAFASDPGWNEAWWWLGIPLALAIFLIVVAEFWLQFYLDWILPEGYGFLELGHFFIPLVGALIAIRMLFRPYVRRRRLVFWYVLLGALGCIYIAGEEHSWGQHFFHWDTPEYWADINRQDETNLHNVSEWFNHKPRSVLQTGIFVGGLLAPVAALFHPWVRRNRWSLFIPAGALVPVSAGAMLFSFSSKFFKFGAAESLVPRPSEATESFIYLFLVFYLIVFARRISELEREEEALGKEKS